MPTKNSSNHSSLIEKCNKSRITNQSKYPNLKINVFFISLAQIMHLGLRNNPYLGSHSKNGCMSHNIQPIRLYLAQIIFLVLQRYGVCANYYSIYNVICIVFCCVSESTEKIYKNFQNIKLQIIILLKYFLLIFKFLIFKILQTSIHVAGVI